MKTTFSAEAAAFVDGATDILHDLRTKPPVRDMEKIRIRLTALGHPASTIEQIVGCFDPRSNQTR